MNTFNKGIAKAEVALKWDPSPTGTPDHDLDIIAATYTSDAPHGDPAYLVHFDSRSPDGTINLNRDSRTGQGFGFDEIMVLELDRLAEVYSRVIVGVAIQQGAGRLVFGDIANAAVRIREGYTELAQHDFAVVAGCTAATVAEFARDGAGKWQFRADVRGFTTDPVAFARSMGRQPA
ncbi:tellurite resistance protein [Streptomyces sp. NBRC 110611]|uniref:TerD family protein n=1 Tax=Streptomyces sp. NBRC 110611 TaxID=1621259 RepID=UPI0008361BD4|nr:TerD family protein [Streptomyces sp. NBRC 110611]GAU69610.1 tellurite resistance protein [Streptomyces sp. NBRC 110611]